jgi:hypothetical protein
MRNLLPVRIEMRGDTTQDDRTSPWAGDLCNFHHIIKGGRDE